MSRLRAGEWDIHRLRAQGRQDGIGNLGVSAPAPDAIDDPAIAFGRPAMDDIARRFRRQPACFGGPFAGCHAVGGFFVELLGDRCGAAHIAQGSHRYAEGDFPAT
jgi:hypothetical protein